MIESIEGKRGMPRLRPPYVAQVGLFGRPTLEHNMETVYWVREIVEKGAQWFASHGRHGRKGLRSFSVSGRVKKPGVHLAPAGITLKELVEEYCGGMLDGHQLYAYLPGGASGGILPASKADIPLDFDTLQPHGCFIGSAAIVVLSNKDKAATPRVNLMKFFHDESCGKCTPCRVGTGKAVALMEEGKWNQPLLKELSQAMMDASICGLGQAAPNPALTRNEVLPARGCRRSMERVRWPAAGDDADRVQAQRPDGRRPARRADHQHREEARRRHPAPLPRRQPALGRQLPRLRGGDQGRARARAVVLPLSERGHGGHHRFAARARVAEDGARAAALGHAGAERTRR